MSERLQRRRLAVGCAGCGDPIGVAAVDASSAQFRRPAEAAGERGQRRAEQGVASRRVADGTVTALHGPALQAAARDAADGSLSR